MFELLSFLLALFVLVQIDDYGSEVSLLPLIYAGLIVISSIYLALSQKEDGFSFRTSLPSFKLISLCLAAVGALSSISYLGFALVTSLLFIFIFYHLRLQRFTYGVVTIVLWNTLLFGLFDQLLGVPFPKGSIFVG